MDKTKNEQWMKPLMYSFQKIGAKAWYFSRAMSYLGLPTHRPHLFIYFRTSKQAFFYLVNENLFDGLDFCGLIYNFFYKLKIVLCTFCKIETRLL